MVQKIRCFHCGKLVKPVEFPPLVKLNGEVVELVEVVKNPIGEKKYFYNRRDHGVVHIPQIVIRVKK